MSRFVIILLIFLSTIPGNYAAQAKELCDCYGTCTIIQPRAVDTASKRIVKIRDGYNYNANVDIDHKLPLSLGGSNDINNLQALTPEEHKIKTERDLLLLYYVQNCLMTVEEAQNEALKPWK